MHPVERLAVALRHSRTFENSLGLWNLLRPWYVSLLGLLLRRGLRRMINGTDLVLLAHELYGVPESYEAEMWGMVMAEARPGDVVADVGASIGLYTVALANRVGPEGQVYSFEPDPVSYDWLSRNVALNKLGCRVHSLPVVVGAEEGSVDFASGRSTESAVLRAPSPISSRVQSVRLDNVLAGIALDLLKIDVEGYELHVLRGAAGLLRDPARGPRSIFVEVHPFAWEQFGVTDCSLLEILWNSGYKVSDLAGNDVRTVERYGVIVAMRPEDGGPDV
jgi:FkbM family methyltransferase